MEAAFARSSSIAQENFKAVTDLLEQGVTNGVFPGAVLLIGRHGDVVYSRAVGNRALSESTEEIPKPMQIDTVFDLAALSATIITTTLLMKMVEAQKISLQDRISRYLQGFGVHGKSPITLAQILNHTSGLVHWYPYFEDLLRENATARMGILTSRGARDYVANAINRSSLKYETGSRQLYSDIGLMVLGFLIEALTGVQLDKAAYKLIMQPLGLKSTSFIDLSMIKRRGISPVTDLIAPTEDCPWRKRILCGEVHDDNAWAMGGIAGHAGLFSTAADVHQFANAIIQAAKGKSSYLTRETVTSFWSRNGESDTHPWRMGWDTPSKDNGMLESGLSTSAVGHNGFTGCSLWIEPEHGVDIVLMSNRIHPTRSNRKIQAYRPELHKAVLTALR